MALLAIPRTDHGIDHGIDHGLLGRDSRGPATTLASIAVVNP
jgi:hypothetical protein